MCRYSIEIAREYSELIRLLPAKSALELSQWPLGGWFTLATHAECKYKPSFWKVFRLGCNWRSLPSSSNASCTAAFRGSLFTQCFLLLPRLGDTQLITTQNFTIGFIGLRRSSLVFLRFWH